jgi:hypothetical protein
LGAAVRGTRITLVLAGLLALCLVGISAFESYAGAWTPRGFAGFVHPEPIVSPVKVFRDCQEIALCTGCKPVYKCRSCEYKRTCTGGVCSWGDVCVWGPYVKVLPPNARIIRIR